MIFLKKEPRIMAQEITTDIRRAIVNGMIKPGERINETQIARIWALVVLRLGKHYKC